jgi:hypothetical protein
MWVTMWDKNLAKKKALVLTRAFLIFGGSGDSHIENISYCILTDRQ